MKKVIITSILFCFFSICAFAQVNLSSGLVAYYPFNGNANDESGNNRNPQSILGASFVSEPGDLTSPVISFTGVYNNSGVVISQQNDLNIDQSSFTLCFKFKTSDNSLTLVRKGFNGSVGGFSTQIDHNGYFAFGMGPINSLNSNDYTKTIWVRSNKTYNDNQWHRVVITCDRSLSQAKIYVDNDNLSLVKNTSQSSLTTSGGTITGNTINFGDMPLSASSTDPLTIGCFKDLGYGGNGIIESFQGGIDQVRIYNRVINETEIKALLTEGQTVNLQNGLVAYYPFNGNANDESGNGNHANMTGASLTADRFDQPNKAYFFDNTIPAYGIINNTLSTDFSIAFWMATSQTGINNGTWFNGSSVISAESTGCVEDFGSALIGNGRLQVGIGANGDCYPAGTNSTSDLSNNNWQFITFTREKASGKISLYVNGTLESSFTTYTNNITFPTRIAFGGDLNHIFYYSPQASKPYFFNGILDDISIYNRTLNQNEIQALYKSCSSNIRPSILLNNNKLNTTLSGTSYQWYKDEVSIAGSNTATLNNTLTEGTYKVAVNINGCNYFSKPYFIGELPECTPTTVTSMITVTVTKIIFIDENGNTVSGINKRLDGTGIQIYPNPARGLVSVYSSDIVIERIEVINLYGVKLLESNVLKDINLSAYPQGTYFFKVFGQGNKLEKTFKVLIE